MLRSAKEVKYASSSHLKGIDENYKWCPIEDWKNYEEIESLLEVFY